MTIAFDAYTGLGGSTGATGNFSLTHTPVGTPRGVVVVLVEDLVITSTVTGITYGGVALTKLGETGLDGAEDGVASIWFLGSGVPTGAQTVTSTGLNAAPEWDGGVFTLTAADDLTAHDTTSATSVASDVSGTLTITAESFWTACAWSAVNTPGNMNPTGAAMTLLTVTDFGNASAEFGYGTALSSTDVTAGWTTNGSDAALFMAAVTEGGGGGGGETTPGLTSTMRMGAP